MSSILVGVVAVDEYNNNVSSPSIYDIQQYIKSVWQNQIEDGSGDYDATFHVIGGIEIPSWYLCDSCSDYWERANDADDWLYNNYDNYRAYDVMTVADYHDNNLDHSGVAQSKAGTTRDKIAITNAKALEDNSLHQPNPIEKISAHELMHMFIDESDSEHYPKVSTTSGTPGGIGTLMYHVEDSTGVCYDGDPADEINDNVSYCTESTVKTFIDNNM